MGIVDECVDISWLYLSLQEEKSHWSPQTEFSSETPTTESQGEATCIYSCLLNNGVTSFHSLHLIWIGPHHCTDILRFEKEKLCLRWNLNVKRQHVAKMPDTFQPIIPKQAAIHPKFLEMFMNYGQSKRSSESTWSKLKPNPPVWLFDL